MCRYMKREKLQRVVKMSAAVEESLTERVSLSDLTTQACSSEQQ